MWGPHVSVIFNLTSPLFSSHFPVASQISDRRRLPHRWADLVGCPVGGGGATAPAAGAGRAAGATAPAAGVGLATAAVGPPQLELAGMQASRAASPMEFNLIF
jgi:hypothetical protein